MQYFWSKFFQATFSMNEEYFLKDKSQYENSRGNSPYLNFKIGLGHKFKLRSKSNLFIETTAETVRGDWFGVDHSIKEFATLMGLGFDF